MDEIVILILKTGRIDEYLELIQKMIDFYHHGKVYFKRKNFDNVPPGYQNFIIGLRLYGIITQSNGGKKKTWKIIDIEKLKRIHEELIKCKNDAKYRILKLSSSQDFQNKQKIMYDLARIIANKLNKNAVDVIFDALIHKYCICLKTTELLKNCWKSGNFLRPNPYKISVSPFDNNQRSLTVIAYCFGYSASNFNFQS